MHAPVHVRRLDRATDGDGISDREEGVPQWRVPNNEVKPLAPIDSDGDGIPGTTTTTLFACVRVCVRAQMWCVLGTLTPAAIYAHLSACTFLHIFTCISVGTYAYSYVARACCRHASTALAMAYAGFLSFRNTGSIPFMTACLECSLETQHPNSDTQIEFDHMSGLWRARENMACVRCW